VTGAQRTRATSTDAGQTTGWTPAAVDVPTASLPLIARVERLAGPLRIAVSEVASCLDDHTSAHLARALSCLDAGLDDAHRVTVTRDRIARSVVAAWLVAWIRQGQIGPEPSRSVRSAVKWFWDLDTDLPLREDLYVARLALDRYGPAEAEGLLPYLLDPFGLTTRRAVLTGTGNGTERRTRKKIGTFYTPGDVARLLSEEAIRSPSGRVLDPACGAGVFLRAAFSRLCSDFGMPAGNAIASLYGIDIDPRAIDACAFVLAHDWLAREPDASSAVGGLRWREARLNLAVANSLRAFATRAPLGMASRRTLELRAEKRAALRERLRRGRVPSLVSVDAPNPSQAWERFPEARTSRFSSLLMNPPFAPAGRGVQSESELIASYDTLAAATRPAGVNLALPFLEVAMKSLGQSGRAGVVLPLSIAYRTDPASVALRTSMSDGGSWGLRFFDRAPDAVFGDDVKQRICLATFTKDGRTVVRTSALTRWSSSHRPEVFTEQTLAGPVVDSDPAAPFPKIGTLLEASVLRRLRSTPEALGDAAVDTVLMSATELRSAPSPTVAVAPTAYNWIGVYRDAALAGESRLGASAKLSALTFKSGLQADAAYALIASRVFLWWWRAVGDLFHVPRRLLDRAPFPLGAIGAEALQGLAMAGRELWIEARRNPVLSTNRGVTTTAYAAADSPELDAADKAVVGAFGLPPRFVRFVREDAKRLAIAGRDT
jgi:SAM-dependent methyltransferase